MANVSNVVKSIQDIMRKDAGTYGDAQRLEQLGWMFFLKIFDDREKEIGVLRDDYKSPLPKHLRWSTWATDAEGITGDALLDFVNNTLLPKLKGLTGGADKIAGLIRMTFEDANNYMKNGTLMRQVVNQVNGIDFNASDDRHMFGDIYEKLLKDLQSAGNAGEFYTPRAVTQFIVEQINPRLGETILDPACGTGGFLVCAIEHLRKQARSEAHEAEIQECFQGIEKKHLPHVLCMTNLLLHGIDVPSNVRHTNTLARPLRDWSPKERVDVIVTNPPFGGMEEDGIESNYPSEFRTRETADLFLVLLTKILKPGGRAGLVLPDGTLLGEGVKTRIKEELLRECNLHTIVRLPRGVFNPYTDIRTNLLFFSKGQPTTEIWYYEHPYPPGTKSYNKGKPISIEEFEGERKWWGKPDKYDKREENEHAWRVSIDQIKAGNYNLDLKNPCSADKGPGDVDHLLPQHERFLAQIAETRAALKKELHQTLTPAKLSLICHKSFDMPPADLRKSILTLAVQGKLAPQVPLDEPAEELIARLTSQEVSDNIRRRKSQPLPSITPDEIPFELPNGWAWERLGNVGETNIGLTYSPQDVSDAGIPVLRSSNIQHGKLDFDDLVRVKCQPKQSVMVQDGDLLICARNGSRALVGKVAVIEHLREPAAFGAFMAIFRSVLNQYLYHFIRSPLFRQMIDEVNTTTINQITQNNLRSTLAPIPPLAEQRRIVAKVDQLMALVDQLETQLAASRAAAEKLMEAVVAELTAQA